MKVLVATDAWHPQVNGVVRTLAMMSEATRALGVEMVFLTPESFRTVAMPGYPGIRLALPRPRTIARLIEEARADAIHIATEGPIGMLVRRYCRARGLAVSSSFHTRFPEYVSARLPVPESWVWAGLRWFHSLSGSVMAATPPLAQELSARGFTNVSIWPRGVDANLFHPRAIDLCYPRPVFLYVGRLAVEKNIEAFLELDLPGTKVVVGDGPQRVSLQRRHRDAMFLGEQFGERLAEIYAAADVFVFPSRTDTFGLVLLEALASGVPVAAFPVTGPRDVIGSAPVGVLHEDLREACLAALDLSRDDCRAFAMERSWEASAQAFLDNIGGSSREEGAEAGLAAARERVPA
jgi:glycosyltransferase involved in cell wall biosynthesis